MHDSIEFTGRPLRAIDLSALRGLVRGRVIGPEDAEYDPARRVWNARAERRPGAIVRPDSADEVAAIVRFAAQRSLLLAVRGGGHSVAGHGVCEGGLVLDLQVLRSVEVDPVARVARVGGGALWGDVDGATARHGLATVGGQISTTGVGGLTVGGGVGWLMREHGLTVDNLLAAEVVTADGRHREVSAELEPDLYWAISGGGGNFGVVTRFTFRLHPVTDVSAGVLLYPVERAAEMVSFFREFVADIPEQLTAMVLLLAGPRQPFVPEEMQGRPVAAFAICHTGSEAAAERDIARLREFGEPAAGSIRRRPYVELQSLFDQGSRAGLRNHWRGMFLARLPDEAASIIVNGAAGMVSPASQVLLTHMEGAVVERPARDTSFGHRAAPYYLEILAKWHEPDEDAPNVAWGDTFHAAVEPYSAGGTYVNFLDRGAGPDDVVAAYGRVSFPRLAELKARFDPANVFRVNHNIPPAS